MAKTDTPDATTAPSATASDAAPGHSSSRRDFLLGAGKFAAVSTPTVTFLLSTAHTTPAVAQSGGFGGGSGGHSTCDGVECFFQLIGVE